MGGVGSGRPRGSNKEKTVQISVNLSPNALILLEAQAKKAGAPHRSKYLEQLIFRDENLALGEIGEELKNLSLFYSTVESNLSELVEMVESQKERLQGLEKRLGLRK
jgi:hypothetical protein